MHTEPYAGERSIGLMPIVLALSAVAVVGFSLLYFAVGRQAQANVSDEIYRLPANQIEIAFIGQHKRA